MAVLDELHQITSGDILPFSQIVEANEPETPDELPQAFGRLYEYGPILRQPRTNRINGPISAIPRNASGYRTGRRNGRLFRTMNNTRNRRKNTRPADDFAAVPVAFPVLDDWPALEPWPAPEDWPALEPWPDLGPTDWGTLPDEWPLFVWEPLDL